MHSLFTSTLDLQRAGKVICVRSLPFDPTRETLLLLAPVGTQCFYMKNAALFLISHFNLVILESDALLSYAAAAGLAPSEGVADFVRQLHAALPEAVSVDAVVGYCSSAPWRFWPPPKGCAANCCCSTALTFSRATTSPRASTSAM